jgi:DNA processing protein
MLKNNSDKLIYQIALTLIPGIGDVLGKKLVAYSGSAEAVFKQKKTSLMKIPGIGKKFASAVITQQVFGQAEEEIRFMEEKAIRPLFYLDKGYPERLKQCADSPMMLYCKGSADPEASRMVGIVGTRKATSYGKDCCMELVEGLASAGVMVVSGLAYGIDVCAHQACLKREVPTIGVLAHGLDVVYPLVHTHTAEKMLQKGALISDYPSRTKLDRENFPRRNRIVAGLCDAIVVIESASEGGSLITADIANSYSRDVFAYPGRITDAYSAGCNKLIRENKAALVVGASDVIRLMGWEEQKKKEAPLQRSLFVELKPEEEYIVQLMRDKGNVHIDELSALAAMPVYRISALLLRLEFQGVLKSLPGKMYRLN